MVDYQKLYAKLVWQADQALVAYETGDLIRTKDAMERLHQALLDAEEAVIEGGGEEE